MTFIVWIKILWKSYHQHSSKYPLLCSTEERDLYRFETTWVWVNDRIWVNYPFNLHSTYYCKCKNIHMYAFTPLQKSPQADNVCQRMLKMYCGFIWIMIHLGNLTYLIFLYTNISRETDVLGFQFCIEKLIKRKCFTAPCCRLNILHRDITLFLHPPGNCPAAPVGRSWWD